MSSPPPCSAPPNQTHLILTDFVGGDEAWRDAGASRAKERACPARYRGRIHSTQRPRRLCWGFGSGREADRWRSLARELCRCAPLRSPAKTRFGGKCVRFGIPFPRDPRNPDVGKPLEQGGRFRVQGSDVLLANLRAAVYLVDHELRVKEHPDALNSATTGELESFDESPIFRNGVDGGSDPFGDLSNWVTVGSLRTTPIAP